MLSKSKLATIVHCTLEEFCTLWHLWRKIRSKLEKYRWENLFVPFQSHLRSDCHIDRLQILIGKNVSHDTLARKSRKMQFVPFPSPRSWYQRDGMLLSNETWGPDQVCLKPLRAAMHHCSVETHPNLWAAIQCTVKFSEMQWNLSNGCTAVQCSWRSAVSSVQWRAEMIMQMHWEHSVLWLVSSDQGTLSLHSCCGALDGFQMSKMRAFFSSLTAFLAVPQVVNLFVSKIVF